MESHSLWIAGRKQPGRGELIPIENPATGQVFARCQSASTEDVEAAVEAAHEAFRQGVWARASRHQRADVLDKCGELLSTALDRLIPLEVEQTGRAIREMKAQVPTLAKWFKYYAALLRVEERPVLPTMGKLHNFMDRVPLGVVVQITSFNHPLLICIKKLAPALAAGNSVIVKPSESTPLTTLLLGEILSEAGIPNGVFNVLPGYGATTGKALCEHPLVKKVDVTGSTAAGRAIGDSLGRNLTKLTAELGGKAPLIVFGDANVDMAVNGIAFGSFIASGQTCVASTRIIVHNSILDAVLAKTKTKVESIKRRIGSPTNPDSMMGPVISAKQLARIEGLVGDALASGHARMLVGGKRMSGASELDGSDLTSGYYYEPTVLASTAKESITRTAVWHDEVFGPVIVVVGFDTEEEAIILANDSEFGLGAGIWTQDMSRAFRVSEQIEAGITWVNTHHRNDPSSPWGGSKSASGVGSENGVDAYHSYTRTKSTIMNFASVEESLAADDWFREGSGNVRYG